jgi:hypothetical protein
MQNTYGIRWKSVILPVIAAALVLVSLPVGAFDLVDLVPGVIDHPLFKGKDPLSRLQLAADLLRSSTLSHSDMAFLLLDWGDQYVREPSDPLERLKRCAKLTSDEKLSQLKIPRDFLNRTLLAEYLVNKTPYVKMAPRERLELVAKLEANHLVDWSVALAYAQLYAGGIIAGAKSFNETPPLEALVLLRRLKDEKLIGSHYSVPTEAILIAEALAMDKDYQKASPYDRLVRLKDLERKKIITSTTKKELEKLPAWRFLVADSSFLKADPRGKRERLMKLEADGLISATTSSGLKAIFRPGAQAPGLEARPAPPPNKISHPGK